MSVEYELTWESVDGFTAASIEDRFGKDIWPRIPWDDLTWHEAKRVAGEDSDIHDQHNTLVRWAESREQPIRNVRLQKFEVQRTEAPDA